MPVWLRVRAAAAATRSEEAKALCTSGMLLCLDREQRLILILGENECVQVSL